MNAPMPTFVSTGMVSSPSEEDVALTRIDFSLGFAIASM